MTMTVDAAQGKADDSLVVASSKEKLVVVAQSLKPWIPNNSDDVVIRPCRSLAETVGYRCKCALQILAAPDTTDDTGGCSIQYAIRQDGKAVPLDNNTFLTAHVRIQRAMKELAEALSTRAALHQHLTSVSFQCSWIESVTKADCLVTLHYDQPIADPLAWKQAAAETARALQLLQLTGRSRKCILRGLEENRGNSDCVMLRDVIYLARCQTNNDSDDLLWKVSTEPPTESQTATVLPVIYHKPEGAFCHPNGRVMCQALEWMLTRLSTIKSTRRHYQLVELYCGFGAHTVPLAATSGVSVTAVEYDARLVEACRENIRHNQLDDKITVIHADAKVWAQAQLRKQQQATSEVEDVILLVDPPRQGLDRHVCDFCMQHEGMTDMLYISCGHEALARDLKILHPTFYTVHVHVLDLFPGTRSVETLVHLRRRQRL